MKKHHFYKRTFYQRILIVILFGQLLGNAYSQTNPAQVIKGIVIDKELQLPLAGATVVVTSTNPLIGGTTDINGNFRLTNVPLGRHSIHVSFIGYEPFDIKEMLVTSGKEVVLSIELKESSIGLNEVTVIANSNKEKAQNAMATLSAIQLNVEQANRYAGGFDDPARLASVSAGVAGNLSNNGIVIRGNAPKGVLWRMEGVEIPTPTHFANITTFGGGGITALSSQMLANSDFFTAAFPAEYGNALSGVFDLKVKTGNNEKTEYTLQAGLIGLDIAVEGPFAKGKKASFAFNYRYSTFSLLGPLLPNNAGGIRYQDLCFKLNLPSAKAGVFTFWGVGALDRNPQKAESDSTLWKYNENKEEGINNLGMGAAGLSHKIIAGKKSFVFTSLSASGNKLDHKQWRYDNDISLLPLEKVVFNNWKYSFSSYINHKFSGKHTNRTGIIVDNLNYNYDINNTDIPGNPLVSIVKEKASTNLLQAYSQSKIDITAALSMNIGIHTQYFTLNDHYSLEPRAGISWRFTPQQSLSVAYGNHSQLEMLQIYMVRKPKGSSFTEPNKNLSFTKANHFVLGYNWKINDNMNLRIEPYYQFLYDVPVIPDSSFSLLNLDRNWFIQDSLTNTGTGINKGIDITFERFLQQGYYYLITASIFDSKYKGGDKMEHNTRYNKHFVVNVLGGKEWILSHNRLLSMNGKVTYMGGDCISPLNEQASLIKKDAVYNEYRAFSDKKPNVLYADFTINYRINRKRHSSTWSLKVINALGAKEYAGYRYNYKTGMMEMESVAMVIPDLSYKIEF